MTTLPSLTGYSYWLLLSDESEARVEKWMARLQIHFESPAFKPHLTLAGIDSAVNEKFPDERYLKKISDELSEKINTFSLKMAGLDGREHPYQPFYIQIKPNEKLISLRKQLMDKLNLEAKIEDYNPHVSLLYGVMNAEKRESLKIKVPFKADGQLLAMGIGLVRVKGTPEDWELIHTASFP